MKKVTYEVVLKRHKLVEKGMSDEQVQKMFKRKPICIITRVQTNVEQGCYLLKIWIKNKSRQYAGDFFIGGLLL